MNNQERQIFWDKLTSLKGKDIDSDIHELLSTIKFPQFLYRYRPINVNTLDSLQTNKLYFSSAAYYDDPFDTYLKIDYKKIYEDLKQSENWKNLAIEKFVEICKYKGEDEKKVNLITEQIQDMPVQKAFDTLTSFFKSEIQPLIRNTSSSICFAESGLNETMWLKYADQYRGFCMMYGLPTADNENFLCGKQDKCKQCNIANLGTPLYPIYYSDCRYDATKYTYNLAHEFFLRRIYPGLPYEDIIKQLDPCVWERERVTLIKSKCHEYDQEWRIILPITSNSACLNWIPYGVILGLKTSNRDQEIIVRSAKIAGVKHIYKSYIDNNGLLDARELNI